MRFNSFRHAVIPGRGSLAISLKKSAVFITIYETPSVQDFDYATFGIGLRPLRGAEFDIFVRHIFNLAKVIKMKLTQRVR